MPDWVGSLWGGLIQVCGTLVGRVMASLGFSYATYSGFDIALTSLRELAESRLGGLPGQALQVIGLLQIGTCVSMLVSALLARLVLSGLVSGSLLKMVLRAPAGGE